DIPAPGYAINYSAENSDHLYSPVLYSQCEISVLIKNNAMLTGFNEMAAEQEQKWYVKIFQEEQLYWTGLVLQDACQYEDQYFPYVFNLVATDGIKALADYREGIEGGNLLECVVKSLIATGVGEMYGTADPFLKTCGKWYSDEMYTTAPPSGLDPLAYTRMGSVHDAIYDVTNSEY